MTDSKKKKEEALDAQSGADSNKAAEAEARRSRILAHGRLLDLDGAAEYMGGVSPWTVRGMINSGALPTVKLPGNGADGRILRRVFVDRRDVDALIEKSKEVEV